MNNVAAWRTAWRAVFGGTFGLFAVGCANSTDQSALDPAGIQAQHIFGLWSVYLWLCVGVYLLTMALVLFAFRSRGPILTRHPVTSPSMNKELRLGIAVAAGILVTTIALFGLMIAEFAAGQSLQSLDEPDAMTIRVTGHQWWWETRYHDATPSEIVTAANEIHIPVGRTIKLELMSGDVIHSFWAPNLHGKTDMIPGMTTWTLLRADRPGIFWGQCAEFCGHQHANMRFLVIAESEAEFDRWLTTQRKPAPEPTTESQKRGRDLFLNGTCATCHTIQGTPAQGRLGPELTHLASRPRIAAGTLPNTRGHLAGWVTDAQGIKPGVRMPTSSLQPGELQALLDYLESLK